MKRLYSIVSKNLPDGKPKIESLAIIDDKDLKAVKEMNIVTPFKLPGSSKDQKSKKG